METLVTTGLDRGLDLGERVSRTDAYRAQPGLKPKRSEVFDRCNHPVMMRISLTRTADSADIAATEP